MEEELTINAERRDLLGKKVNVIRREGRLPAILYGREMDPIPITLDLLEASRLLSQAASSTLMKVQLEDESLPVLVRETQRDVMLGTLVHVDFQVVSLTDTVRASVAIHLEGQSPAVVDNNAVMVTGVEELELECLPQDLPSRIAVDISSLEDVGDSLFVRDLPLPPEVNLLTDPDELVAVVTWIAEEAILEEEEELELVPELGEPELVGREEEEEFIEEEEAPEE